MSQLRISITQVQVKMIKTFSDVNKGKSDKRYKIGRLFFLDEIELKEVLLVIGLCLSFG